MPSAVNIRENNPACICQQLFIATMQCDARRTFKDSRWFKRREICTFIMCAIKTSSKKTWKRTRSGRLKRVKAGRIQCHTRRTRSCPLLNLETDLIEIWEEFENLCSPNGDPVRSFFEALHCHLDNLLDMGDIPVNKRFAEFIRKYIFLLSHALIHLRSESHQAFISLLQQLENAKNWLENNGKHYQHEALVGVVHASKDYLDKLETAYHPPSQLIQALCMLREDTCLMARKLNQPERKSKTRRTSEKDLILKEMQIVLNAQQQARRTIKKYTYLLKSPQVPTASEPSIIHTYA